MSGKRPGAGDQEDPVTLATQVLIERPTTVGDVQTFVNTTLLRDGEGADL